MTDSRIPVTICCNEGLSCAGSTLAAGVREKVFPGAAAWVSEGGICRFHGTAGWAGLAPRRAVLPETWFDLASLTKPIATTSLFMCLAADGLLSPETLLGEILPFWQEGKRKEIRLEDLLRHRAGLTCHRHFYKVLESTEKGQRKAALSAAIRNTPLDAVPGTRTLYSDLGFMVLREAMEAVGGDSFEKMVKEKVVTPLGIPDLFFPSDGLYRRKENFAATSWSRVRQRRLAGEVDDENAAFTGGGDGHAGLFGTAAAVGRFGERIIAGFHGEDPWGDQRILRDILRIPEGEIRPMGWDRVSGERPSAGRWFSRSGVGHLGFTGTSLWLDLQRRIVVVLLTNRVHFGAEHTAIRSFRPRFHDCVMKGIMGG